MHALAAQFAAEATLERVRAIQGDTITCLVAAIDTDIRTYKNEITVLQDEKKAMEHLMKSKEAALQEARKDIHNGQERSLMIEDLLNQNLELKKQIEICQVENTILEKTNSQKAVERAKLARTILKLEEYILDGGAAANAVRKFQHQIAELNEENKILQRELTKAKVKCVALVLADEWKDSDEKAMPAKRWLEEKKYLQGEIQRLRGKLAISERAAKVEAQLKDKLKLRLSKLEEVVKHVLTLSTNQATISCQSFSYSSSTGIQREHSSSQPRASLDASKLSVSQQPDTIPGRSTDAAKRIRRLIGLRTKLLSSENLIKNTLQASRSKFVDDYWKEDTENNANSDEHADEALPQISDDSEVNGYDDDESEITVIQQVGCKDMASGLLYEILKDAISLKKLQEEKEEALGAKEDEIQFLQKEVDASRNVMATEAKNMCREAAPRQKELLHKSEDIKQNKTINIFKRLWSCSSVKHSGAS